MAYHNKLLTKDALEFTVAEEPMLHQNVLKLLPTLHGLLYAIDTQDLINAGEDSIQEEFKFLKSELNLMLAGKAILRKMNYLIQKVSAWSLPARKILK